MLHTGYGTDFGTGLVVDGVGVNAANMFPGATSGPGRRIVAPLSSTLVMRAGQPWIGLGTPGYPPPCVSLVLLNLLTYAMDLPEAIEAPRFAPEPGGAEITFETRTPASTIVGLEQLGISAVPVGDYNAATGRINAISRTVDGQLLGIVDPRASGRAAGL